MKHIDSFRAFFSKESRHTSFQQNLANITSKVGIKGPGCLRSDLQTKHEKELGEQSEISAVQKPPSQHHPQTSFSPEILFSSNSFSPFGIPASPPSIILTVFGLSFP